MEILMLTIQNHLRLKQLARYLVNTELVLGIEPVASRKPRLVASDDIEAQIAYLQARLQELGGPKLRQTPFQLDDHTRAYKGWTLGDLWEGWDMPFFEKEVADQIAQDLDRLPFSKTWYDPSQNGYYFCLNGRPHGAAEKFTSRLIEDQMLYPLGAGSWKWLEASPGLEYLDLLTRDDFLTLLEQGLRDFSGLVLSDVIYSIDEKSSIDLQKANLSRANLSFVYMRGVNLSGATLQKSTLIEANLNHANLSRANLKDTLLVKAQLNRADLTEANLAGANLAGAELNQALLYGVRLDLADLTGKWEVGNYQFNKAVSMDGARYDHSTKWPTGFSPLVNRAIKEQGHYQPERA